MTDSTGENNAIVQAQPQQLAVRHAWLVERGLHSLPILEITQSRVQELCSNLWDSDFDNRTKTLEAIVALGTHIRSCRRHLDSLIFPVVGNMYEYFGPEATVGYNFQHDLFSHGHNYPPGAEYLDLLRTALQSLVGPVMSPDEAILDVYNYGTTASQILAIEWLADHRLTASTHELFSDSLRMSLLSTARRAPLLFALKYADAAITYHVDEAICFFADAIILGDTSVDLMAKARDYLVRLHECASQAAIIHAFGVLAGSSDPQDRECASELFDDVMCGDLDEYSADDLEMICYFRGWPSGAQDEVDEYEVRVMEELRRRELEG